MDGQFGLDADYLRSVFPFIQREKFHADNKPVPMGPGEFIFVPTKKPDIGLDGVCVWWVGGGWVCGWVYGVW